MTENAMGRADRWLAAAVTAGLFVVYALGACQTIYVGDSGELVTAVHVLGIPHPSGYPLYVLLGKLWTIMLPVGSIAFRMSLFSAACAALACALVFLTVRRGGGSRIAGLFGAGLLAFGPSFWQEANIQRVYALNALLLILAIDRAFAWQRLRRPRDLVLTMLVCGLGATNHTFMGLVGVAVAIWAPLVDPGLFRRPKIVASCGGAFLAGLAVYAFLPIRTRMNPVLNWGEPNSVKGFLDVVLRRDFWHRAWWESPADLVPILGDFVRSLGPETGLAGAALALIVLIVRPDRKWLLAVLVIALNIGAVARHGSYYDIFVWHRYYIPAYLAIALLAASGLDAVTARTSPRVALLALFVPIGMLLTGWDASDRSHHRYAEEFSRMVLDSLPPGAKLVTTDDNVLFALLYLKHVEGLRPDVQMIAEGVNQRKPNLFFDPDVDSVFFTHPPAWRIDGLAFAPRGVVLQAVRDDRPFPAPIEHPPLFDSGDPAIPLDYLTRVLIAHDWFMRAMTWEYRHWARAGNALREAERAAPDSPLILYNLGLIHARNGFFDDAVRVFEAADRINPRGIDGGIDPGTGKPVRIRAAARAAESAAERARIRALESRLAPSIPRLIEPGSRSWHNEMADQLAARGETIAARAHALRASIARE